MVPIVQYTQRGYFGDSDIFSSKIIGDKGRDCTAIASHPATIFLMNTTELNKIKKKFPEVYKEMEE